MDFFKDFNEKIKQLFENNKNKKTAFIAFLGIAGIVMIFISEIIPDKTEIVGESKEYNIDFDSSDSCSDLEKKLESVISKIKGAGKTNVMLTFNSSEEYFYASNSSVSRDEEKNESQNELVIIEKNNNEEPIILKKTEAKIRGVFVICEGGGNAIIKEKIIEALCALLDIPSNKVSVAEMA